LFSFCPLQAATNLKLSGFMPFWGGVYSVPLVGGTPGIKMNSNLVSGGDVSIFQISPDGTRVVYGADQDAFTRLELYSVSINGPTGSAIKLNGPLVANGEVNDFQISPDSRRVVYRGRTRILTNSWISSVSPS
jgi:hypothetical protein